MSPMLGRTHARCRLRPSAHAATTMLAALGTICLNGGMRATGFVPTRQLSVQGITRSRPSAVSSAPLLRRVYSGPPFLRPQDSLDTPLSQHGFPCVLQATATNYDFAKEHLWLEDVEGENALNWVKQRNDESLAALGDPKKSELHNRLLSIYDSKDKIPYATKSGDYLYNFWKDDKNIRGIWRRTSFEEYRKNQPKWETVLDLDALGKEEGVSWVWKSVQVLKEGPGTQIDRALISLSRGGSDAAVVREFDLVNKRFVTESEGGFVLPEGKSGVTWQSRDVLIVGTNFGKDSLTDSGYPRVVKEWKRGTSLGDAGHAFEGIKQDVSVSGWVTKHGGVKLEWRGRSLTFYTSRTWVRALPAKGEAGGAFREVPVPNHANVSPFGRQLLVSLREPWSAGGTEYPSGSLLSVDMEDVLQNGDKASYTMLFCPTPRSSLQGFDKTKNFLILTVLNNVKTELQFWRSEGGKWVSQGGDKENTNTEIKTISVRAVDSEDSDEFWKTSNSFIVPPTLSITDSAAPGVEEVLKSLPEQYNAAGLEVTQGAAISSDGTEVPYFLVRRKDAPNDGSTPTLLYSYGGFEVPLLPGYSAEVGASWLEKGGAYVVANIRGGGEFGPAWHQAALKQNRQRAYDDFYAVAEDLIARGITTSKRLGIRGGSNGGLLVGNALVQRPELWGAVVCAVPLLDMKRFHLLLAGASWMAEYGNPDTDDWKYLEAYSPYHQVDEAMKYPPVLFTTSTRDDRVHPGHARKMVKRLIEAGKQSTTYYYENMEGGHGGAADSKQQAFISSLVYNFLWDRLSEL